MLSFITGFVGDLFGIGRDYLQSRRRVKEAETQTRLAIEKAKAESAVRLAETGQTAEIQWDLEAQKNSGSSWKDEYLTILVSIPLILAFIPGVGAGLVLEGFNVLRLMPDWYMQVVAVTFAAAFGFKKLTEIFSRRSRG